MSFKVGGIIISVLLVILTGYFYLRILVVKADVNTSNIATYITNSIKLTYKDPATQVDISEKSKDVKVKKVSPIYIKFTQKGRTDDKKKPVNLRLVDPTSQEVSQLTLSTDPTTGNQSSDWTDLNINSDNKFNLRLDADGYLSKIISNTDITNGEVNNFNVLQPGDIDNNGNIDIQDYVTFKRAYSNTDPNSLKADFSGDGKVDYFDYAMSFGSCYSGTVSNQAERCR